MTALSLAVIAFVVLDFNKANSTYRRLKSISFYMFLVLVALAILAVPFDIRMANR